MLTMAGAGLGLAVTPPWLAYALKFLMPPSEMQFLVAMDTQPGLRGACLHRRRVHLSQPSRRDWTPRCRRGEST